MNFIRNARLLFRFSVLILLLSSLSIPSKAGALADSVQLSKQKVRDWINTRIATAKLQNKLKANATDYDNVVQTFFTKRETLLQSKGWTVDEFEAVEKRINAATSAMDMADDLKNSKADHNQQLKVIKSNKYYSDKQKEQMIAAIRQVREQQKAQFIDPTKSDWSAVQPYRKTLEKLTDWVAGNIPNPPKVPM